jgi:hypothetical protein
MIYSTTAASGTTGAGSAATSARFLEPVAGGAVVDMVKISHPAYALRIGSQRDRPCPPVDGHADTLLDVMTETAQAPPGLTVVRAGLCTAVLSRRLPGK